MSWHFSQALVEDYSAAYCLDGDPSAAWKSIPFASDDSSSDKMKDIFHASLYGIMFAPLTDTLGTGLLKLFQADFHVNPSAQPPTEMQPQLTYGQKCFASFKKSSQSLCSLKMSLLKPLTGPHKTVSRQVIKPKSALFPRKTWVLTTFGKDTGYLHTPTCASNYTADSMQKHKNCRVFVQVFGKGRNPANAEWMMGWPIGWTDLKPLGTDRFQQWQQQHGQS